MNNTYITYSYKTFVKLNILLNILDLRRIY